MVDDLKNFSPEEKLRKLKELQKKKKQELAEAEKEIKESEEELSDQQKFLEKVPIPEVTKEDLAGLSESAREILKMQRGFKGKKAETEEGKALRITVPKKELRKGDEFTMYVDGEAVKTKTVKKNEGLVLKYAKARKLDAGDTINIEIGRKLAFGKGEGKVVSDNAVKGAKLKVTVAE